MEEALTQDVPDFGSAEALLDWYVARSRHLLELRVAQAFALLESIDDSAIHEAAHKFVMVPPEGLRYRVRHYTDQLDRRLAEFIRTDPKGFQFGKRSALDPAGSGTNRPPNGRQADLDFGHGRDAV